MKIATQSNIANQASQPKFGQNYLVQVAKNAFTNQDDLQNVSRVFSASVRGIVGDAPSSLDKILGKFGIPQKHFKVFTFLESPLRLQIAEDLKSADAPSIHWFSQHIGSPVKPPIDPNYHSFFVLTQENRDNALNLFSRKRMKFVVNQISTLMQKLRAINAQDMTPEKIARENKKNIYWIHAQLDGLLAKEVGESDKSFKIDSLSELPKVFESIEI